MAKLVWSKGEFGSQAAWGIMTLSAWKLEPGVYGFSLFRQGLELIVEDGGVINPISKTLRQAREAAQAWANSLSACEEVPVVTKLYLGDRVRVATNSKKEG